MVSGNRTIQPYALLIVTILCFLAGALYAWSAIIPALGPAFDVGAQDAGMVFSLAIVAFTTLGLAVPRLPDRYRGMRGAIIASLAGAAALCLAASAPNFAIFVLTYSLGFGGASGAVYFLGLELAAATKNPKLTTAMMVASFGLGGVVFGPLLRLLVEFGLGIATLLVPAFCILLTVVIATLVLRNSKVSWRLDRPRNATSTDQAIASSAGIRGTIALLWLTMATGSAAGLMTLGLATTVVESQGGTVWLSGLTLSGVAIGNTGGRLIIGALPRHVPVGLFVALASFGSVCGLLLSAATSNPAFVAAGMIMVAMGYGTAASGIPVLTQMLFGPNRFGRVYSIVFTAWGVAGLVSPWLAGAIFDTYGNFTVAFLLAAGSSMISCVLLLRIARLTP